jgi:hypothetical protein
MNEWVMITFLSNMSHQEMYDKLFLYGLKQNFGLWMFSVGDYGIFNFNSA